MAYSQIRVVDIEVMSRGSILGVFKVKPAGLAVWIQEVSWGWGIPRRTANIPLE